VAFLPRMCVEQEIEQGLLREVKVKELHVERKIRLIYPTRRVLSHAARAFLEVLGCAHSRRVSGSVTRTVYAACSPE
jgi:DNA-binding transcriptional LysR family regulator